MASSSGSLGNLGFRPPNLRPVQNRNSAFPVIIRVGNETQRFRIADELLSETIQVTWRYYYNTVFKKLVIFKKTFSIG